MQLPPRLNRVEGHTFIPSLLPKDAVVVDLGANTGRFSATMAGTYGYRCFCVEPTPEIWERIPNVQGLQKYNMAITPQDGLITFHVADNSECSSIHAQNLGTATLRAIEVKGQRLDHFLADVGLEHVDVLKMDIEGAEFEVLQQLPDECLRRIGQLLVEFHPGVNGRTKMDVRAAVSRLRKLGFVGAKMSMLTHADYLFVNRHIGASAMQLFSLGTLKRYCVYAGRAWHEAKHRLKLN